MKVSEKEPREKVKPGGWVSRKSARTIVAGSFFDFATVFLSPAIGLALKLLFNVDESLSRWSVSKIRYQLSVRLWLGTVSQSISILLFRWSNWYPISTDNEENLPRNFLESQGFYRSHGVGCPTTNIRSTVEFGVSRGISRPYIELKYKASNVEDWNLDIVNATIHHFREIVPNDRGRTKGNATVQDRKWTLQISRKRATSPYTFRGLLSWHLYSFSRKKSIIHCTSSVRTLRYNDRPTEYRLAVHYFT